MKRTTLIWMLALAIGGFAAPAAAAIDDHVDRCHGATTLRENSSLPGYIDRAGDRDFFVIYVPGSHSVDLRLYSEGTTDTLGRLYDSGCREIWRDDDSGSHHNFSINKRLHPGHYYVSVQHYDRHRSHGAYEIFFELHRSSQTCSTHYAPVCGRDGHTYSNQCVLDRAGAHKAYDGECRSDQGDVCGDSSQCAPGYECVFPRLPGGAIPIAGTCERSRSNHHQRDNNTCSTATRVRPGARVNAAIDYPGDVDVYRIDLPQPRQSCVCVTSPCYCPGDDIYLDLFQTAGHLPTTAVYYDSRCRQIRPYFSEDQRHGPFWGVAVYENSFWHHLGGTVFVAVRHESSHGTGRYRFETVPLLHRNGQLYLRR